MTETTPRLALTELTAAQAQKHVTVNQALIALDAFTNTQVTSMALTAPPDDPSDGDCYIVADSATDDWADYDGKLAYCIDGDWTFYTPFTGQMIYNAADSTYYRYSGSAWVADFPSLSTANTWSAEQAFDEGASIGGYSVSLGGAFTTGGALTFSGAYAATFSVPGAYTWTLPAQSGTLAELSLAQTWTAEQTITCSYTGLIVRVSGTHGISFHGSYPGIGFNYTYTTSGRVNIGDGYSAGIELEPSSGRLIISGSPSGSSGDTVSKTDNLFYMTQGRVFMPAVANAGSVGSTSSPFANGYFENGVTTTSDEQLKRNKSFVTDSDALLAVGWQMAKHISAYQMLAAVSQKGDAARYHFGVSSQDAMAAFDAAGLDWKKYGIVCARTLDKDYLAPDGKTVLLKAGATTYYVRQEEADKLIMAALVARLSGACSGPEK